MARTDYRFDIFPNTSHPFGPVPKENLDVVRFLYDFTCWLDTDLEGIGGVSVPQIAFENANVVAWQTDYPLSGATSTAPPVDTYPPGVQSYAITNAGRSIEIWVNAGTPGLTYIMSFVATSSLSQRRKQVDTLISIEQPLNALMVGSTPVETPGQVIVIGGSTNLPVGFDGLVVFENGSDQSGIIITLPPSPVLGQEVEFIDALGKDQAYPVTFQADSGAAIDGDGSVTFTSSLNYDCLRWRWTGANWHLMSTRFNFLA